LAAFSPLDARVSLPEEGAEKCAEALHPSSDNGCHHWQAGTYQPNIGFRKSGLLVSRV